LRSREVVVRAVGRGAAARPRTARLLLPGPGGAVADSTVTIRGAGTIGRVETIRSVGTIRRVGEIKAVG
ncbi:MAG: hypothetical protein ACRDS1_10310, partial [Pseudonocardiaceae bacterium]